MQLSIQQATSWKSITYKVVVRCLGETVLTLIAAALAIIDISCICLLFLLKKILRFFLFAAGILLFALFFIIAYCLVLGVSPAVGST
ncbi:MAG: hypothetical protein V2I36_17770, partial [Desulfopila sp.]|nr:hypothetical protein [Desulfopila sp.]